MPEISRFYGIIIAMFYSEHNPPHFHARYGGDKIAIEIKTLQVLEGWIPPRALGLAMEWASQHQDELMRDWEQARSSQTPERIEPLK
jgi:phosphomannomutase